MKPYLIIALIILNGYCCNAQDFLWANMVKSQYPISYEIKPISTTDVFGNIYDVGSFKGNTNFSTGGNPLILTSSNEGDFYIRKLSGSGDILWVKQLTNFYTKTEDWRNQITAIEADNIGNIYLTGFFHGKVDFNPGTDALFLESYIERQAFILKLDTAGNLVWVKHIQGALRTLAYCLTIDKAMNIYIGGQFEGTADMNPGPDTSNLTTIAPHTLDAFVLKLNKDGDFIRVLQFGGSNEQSIYNLKTDAGDNLYIKGAQDGNVDLDPGPATYQLNPGAFFLKLDTAGNFVWAKPMAGLPFEINDANKIYNVTTFGQIRLEQQDTSGNTTWIKEIVASRSINAQDLSIGPDGSIFITGTLQGIADFDPGQGVYYLHSDSSLDPYIPDIFILKLTKDGTFVWAQKIGNQGIDQGTSVNTDALGNAYLSGCFAGTVDFDNTPTTYNLSSPSITATAPFLLKLSYTTGINNIIKPNFTVTPNPASSILHISDITGITAIKLTDIQGRTIRSYAKPVANIDVSMLASGMYLMQLQTTEGVYTHKFVKE